MPGGTDRCVFSRRLRRDPVVSARQLLDKVTHVLHDNLHVERLTVVDNGTGGAVPNHVRGLTGSIAAFLEQLKTSTGVDVPAILRGNAGEGDDDEGGAKRSSARGPLGHKGH